jgi:phosphoglycerate dehydrogenase-like enzyme
LGNIVMTPHMSGWTSGTIRRRQETMADNIKRRVEGRACVNVVRSAMTGAARPMSSQSMKQGS